MKKKSIFAYILLFALIFNTAYVEAADNEAKSSDSQVQTETGDDFTVQSTLLNEGFTSDERFVNNDVPLEYKINTDASNLSTSVKDVIIILEDTNASNLRTYMSLGDNPWKNFENYSAGEDVPIETSVAYNFADKYVGYENVNIAVIKFGKFAAKASYSDGEFFKSLTENDDIKKFEENVKKDILQLEKFSYEDIRSRFKRRKKIASIKQFCNPGDALRLAYKELSKRDSKHEKHIIFLGSGRSTAESSSKYVTLNGVRRINKNPYRGDSSAGNGYYAIEMLNDVFSEEDAYSTYLEYWMQKIKDSGMNPYYMVSKSNYDLVSNISDHPIFGKYKKWTQRYTGPFSISNNQEERLSPLEAHIGRIYDFHNTSHEQMQKFADENEYKYWASLYHPENFDMKFNIQDFIDSTKELTADEEIPENYNLIFRNSEPIKLNEHAKNLTLTSSNTTGLNSVKLNIYKNPGMQIKNNDGSVSDEISLMIDDFEVKTDSNGKQIVVPKNLPITFNFSRPDKYEIRGNISYNLNGKNYTDEFTSEKIVVKPINSPTILMSQMPKVGSKNFDIESNGCNGVIFKDKAAKISLKEADGSSSKISNIFNNDFSLRLKINPFELNEESQVFASDNFQVSLNPEGKVIIKINETNVYQFGNAEYNIKKDVLNEIFISYDSEQNLYVYIDGIRFKKKNAPRPLSGGEAKLGGLIGMVTELSAGNNAYKYSDIKTFIGNKSYNYTANSIGIEEENQSITIMEDSMLTKTVQYQKDDAPLNTYVDTILEKTQDKVKSQMLVDGKYQSKASERKANTIMDYLTFNIL